MKSSPADTELDKQQETPLRFTYPSGSRPLEGYQVKRGVGRGGFGEVYFAVSDAGKEVALKLIRRNLDVEVRGVTQCLNLKHPNLVALYDIRTDELDDRWVVMEYVSGESLEDVIDRYPGGMPIDLAMHWFEGVAAGVAYLHDHGIVHRDLKPANIFIDEGVVKLGDYGLSKFISCSRRSGQTESVGTVHYMAPEIANGRYGKEIDTYALGIILYEMLTGHVPFEGESVGEVLMKHLTAEPDLDMLDEPYREIVRSAMAKDPDTRIQNVASMLEKLPKSSSLKQTAEYRFPTATEAASPQFSGERVEARGAYEPNEEPIFAEVREGWRVAEQRFRDSNAHPLLKAVFSVGMIALVLFSFELWLPTLFVLGFSYLIYRAIRAVVVHPSSMAIPPTSPVDRKAGPGARVPTPQELNNSPPLKQTKRQYARRKRHSWQQKLNKHVAAKPMRVRGTELLGSMIVSAVISSLLALLGCAIVSETFSMELYLWMTIVAMFGSWAVMIPTKLLEGHLEDQAPLRFSMLISGALLGLIASATAGALLLDLPVSKGMGIYPGDSLADSFLSMHRDGAIREAFNQGAVPISVPTATAYFGFLFVLLRWWRQAEYTRTARVGIWSIAGYMLAAFLLTLIWWFPQPMGLVLAGMIAFATQLSSPWMPPSKRRALAEQGVV